MAKINQKEATALGGSQAMLDGEEAIRFHEDIVVARSVSCGWLKSPGQCCWDRMM